MASVIKDGESLILKYVQDKGSYILKAEYNQKIGSSRVSLKDVVGDTFTKFYELKGRKLERIVDATAADSEVVLEDDEPEEIDSMRSNEKLTIEEMDNLSNNQITDLVNSSGASTTAVSKKPVKGDNSGYIDTNTAQKLSTSDIAELRAKGMSGAEIIKMLTANSSTFNIKSDFAQEKYIKRKEKRYQRTFQLLPANPSTICEAESVRHRDKVMNLRVDTLAQILGQSGVHAGTHVMVIESMTGLIVGACAYRMQGSGKIIAVYGGQQPHLEMVRNFNLDAAALSIIQNVPAPELGPAAKDVSEKGFHTLVVEQNTEMEGENEEEEVKQPEIASHNEMSEEEANEAIEAFNSTNTKKRKRLEEEQESAGKVKDVLTVTGRAGDALYQARCSLRQGVDRLIIACKYRPLPVLKQALVLLAPSAPFVVFHEYLEPLVECFQYMQENQMAVRMVLSDTWFREFQTLPGRVRPEMFMSTTGGYLLYGIYIALPTPYRTLSAADERAQEQHAQAKAAKLEKHPGRRKRG